MPCRKAPLCRATDRGAGRSPRSDMAMAGGIGSMATAAEDLSSGPFPAGEGELRVSRHRPPSWLHPGGRGTNPRRIFFGERVEASQAGNIPSVRNPGRRVPAAFRTVPGRKLALCRGTDRADGSGRGGEAPDPNNFRGKGRGVPSGQYPERTQSRASNSPRDPQSRPVPVDSCRASKRAVIGASRRC
jgi:hypothetical protein